MTGSIRSRTLLLVLLLLTVTTSLLTYKSYRDARHEIEELFDARLAQSARLLEGLLHGSEPESTRQAMQLALDQGADSLAAGDEKGAHPYESKLSFQLLDQAGEVQLESAQAPHEALPRLLAQLEKSAPNAKAHGSIPAIQALAAELPGFHDLRLGAYEWRVFLLHEPAKGFWILVGERDDVRGELVQKIVLRSLMSEILGLPLIGLLVWFYIMETIVQSTSLFTREESFIKGTTLPLTVYVMRLTMESIIRAGYAAIGSKGRKRVSSLRVARLKSDGSLPSVPDARDIRRRLHACPRTGHYA